MRWRVPGKSRGRTRGVLAVIGGLMVASALVRLGAGTAEALEEMAPGTETTTAASGQMVGDCVNDEGLTPVLEALQTREDRLAQREADLRKRLQALSVAETEIDRKMAALQTAEERLRATLTMAQTAADDDVAQLTQVYAAMKPKQAAALFEEMDPDFAAGFLGRMRPDAASAILAGLTPQKAYTISVILAGRNADAPRE